jgi:Kelch motif
MGVWTAGGNLNTGRESMPAITLQDGRVLVAGGWAGGTNSQLATCEICTADGSAWSFTGSLPVATTENRLLLMPNGKVLSIGGSPDNGEVIADNHVSSYDPSTGVWTSLAPLNTARFGFGCWLLPSGKVLVAGGWSTAAIASSEIYDPAMNTWTFTGSLNQARFYGGDNTSGSGKIVMMGGAVSSPSTVTNTIEIYDIGSGTWTTQSATLPSGFGTNTPGLGQISITLQDGTILWVGGIISYPVGGGNPASVKTGVYNADTDTFATKGNLSLRTDDAPLFVLPNGKVILAGGSGGLDTDPTYNTVEIYDPIAGTWANDAPLPVKALPGQWWSPVLLNGSQPFVIGGVDTGILHNTQIYTFTPPAVSSQSSMMVFFD